MIYLVVWVHWFADFVCQTRTMANNKSTSLKWLSSHVFVYTLFLIPFGLKFSIINGLAHFLTDFWTSKFTNYFYKKQNIHKFFVVIGLDQVLHLTVLIYTLPLIGAV